MTWELVAGVETHIELSTKSKIFCQCTTEFGGEPNTHCCPVCIGLPGTLPKLNEKVVEYAIKAGLATNCKINNFSKMDRKNYVYPDLPKAYQISQYDKPLCENGFITLSSGKNINIERIHIEEDAGKLIHGSKDTYIDYNRGGIPLIEVVSAPSIRSIEEAVEYIEKLRLIIKYIGVSDVKMQEGSLRCDVNISVRKKGEKQFGTRVEIKNMNSLSFIAKAMEYEFQRQIDILECGKEVEQETRRYNSGLNITESMRGKEQADDYRYFREPDLVNIFVLDAEIKKYINELPELPQEKHTRFINVYNLPEDDAWLLIKYKKIAEYYEKSIKNTKNKRLAANYILGPIFRRLTTEQEREECSIPIPPEFLNELILMVEEKKINSNIARNALEQMLDAGKSVTEFISQKDMEGIEEVKLKQICEKAVTANEKAVTQYLSGKEKALAAVIGNVMKETKGKADAVLVTKIVKELIRQ